MPLFDTKTTKKRGKTTPPEGTIKCDSSVNGRIWLKQAFRSDTKEVYTYCVTCGWVEGDCLTEASATELTASCTQCGTMIRTREHTKIRGGIFGR